MKKNAFVFFILLLSSTMAFGSAIKNAYAALSIYDYFKARALFMKLEKHDTVAACFGLSIISSRNDNHFYNVDTAYSYLLKAKKTFSTSTLKQRKNWQPYGIDSLSI